MSQEPQQQQQQQQQLLYFQDRDASLLAVKNCLSYSEVDQNPAMMTIASGYCMDWNVEERSQQKNGWMESEGGEEKQFLYSDYTFDIYLAAQ